MKFRRGTWAKTLCLLVPAMTLWCLVGPGAAVAFADAPRQPGVANPLGLDNPSGKTDNRGRPLQRAASHTTAKPQVTATATPQPECPPTVHCVFIPAAYTQNDPNDPSNYGNYDTANRLVDGPAINQIVIHNTEGSLADTIAAFQDPLFFASAHYVIDRDGTIYQMVQTKNVAWQAGNWYTNQHSIGIEHVGRMANGATDYTPAMYNASATLVRWLAARNHIQLDRQHIIGHDNVPAPTAASIPLMHWDPGPFWDWQRYMALLAAPVVPGSNNKIVTIAPTWPLSKQPVQDCSSGTCVSLPLQPTNFVYLRTAPNASAPLLTDPVLGQGTTDIASTAAKAYYGQKFAVADTQLVQNGRWYKVWYDGQTGWFFSPWQAPAAFPGSGKVATPKAGLAGIPVYGRAYPAASTYPADFTAAPSVVTLPYTIPAGQKYTVVSGPTPIDYYYAWTINSSLPYDHTVFKGPTNEYVGIQFNGRLAYLKMADVSLN